jgi:hypothetical protein
MLKKAYYYLFYKLFRFWEVASVPKFWSEWKAGLSVDVLWFLNGFSLLIYYNIYWNRYFILGDGKWLIVAYITLIFVPNYFIFHHKDKWKPFNLEFNKLSKKKNRIGSLIVFAVVLLSFANMIYAFYLMSTINWQQYR